MDIQRFVRRPFNVDAVFVTDENMEEVAKWCGGDIQQQLNSAKSEEENPQKFIKVEVFRAMTKRQTMAFAGDWVLHAGSGFKVYTSSAFEKYFEKVQDGNPYHTQSNAQSFKSSESSLDAMNDLSGSGRNQ